MTKQLFIEGFTITPIAKAIDLEAGTSEPVGLGEQRVDNPAAGAAFFTDHWPMTWDSLRAQFVQQQEAELAAPVAPTAGEPPRRARRAAAKKPPAKKRTLKAV